MLKGGGVRADRHELTQVAAPELTAASSSFEQTISTHRDGLLMRSRRIRSSGTAALARTPWRRAGMTASFPRQARPNSPRDALVLLT